MGNIGVAKWKSPFSSLYTRKIDGDVTFAIIEPARWRLPVGKVYCKSNGLEQLLRKVNISAGYELGNHKNINY